MFYPFDTSGSRAAPSERPERSCGDGDSQETLMVQPCRRQRVWPAAHAAGRGQVPAR